MRFKIISVGWDCADLLDRTLHSISRQDWSAYDVVIVDDATEDPRQAKRIKEWCLDQGSRWRAVFNTTRRGPVVNQMKAIALSKPADDDVIVWLDLDGDRFAHPGVLEILADAYEDRTTMMTYGTYKPIPDPGYPVPVGPYPLSVIVDNAYRADTLANGPRWNHLRTMRGDVVKAIPRDQFTWRDGRFYEHGADYVYMTCGLELAGGRHKWIPEVLCLYNAANPRADNICHPVDTNRCVGDFLQRPPLQPLEVPA
jgi:glycosyltransferase involved in cell wall biosynthesis